MSLAQRIAVLCGSALVISIAAIGRADPASVAAGGRWAVDDLGTFGAKQSEALAVNELGQVLVRSDGSSVRYLLWQNGRARNLGMQRLFSDPLLNNRGQVLGEQGGGYSGFRYLLWQNGRSRDLGVVSAGVAVSFDDRGGIAAAGSDAGSGVFLRQNGRWRELPRIGAAKASTVGGAWSYAADVNSLGQVVGELSDSTGIGHAALWQNGHWTLLSGGRRYESSANCINERGIITGRAVFSPGDGRFPWQAFVVQGGRLHALGTLGGPGSSGGCMNRRGQIVGAADTTVRTRQGAFVAHAFLWQNGHMTDLGTTAGGTTSSYASLINERGQIVGASDTTLLRQGGTDAAGHSLKGEPIPHAFVWQRGRIIDLPALPGGKETMAKAINNRGQIVGWSTTRSGEKHAVIWERR